MKRRLIIHPLLFGIFPLLFLYAQNATEMSLEELAVPVLLTGGGSLVLTAVLSLFLRSLRKGALLSTVMIVLFFSYGHIVGVVPDFAHQMAESIFGPSLLVLLVFFAILFAFARVIVKTRRDLGPITFCLNWLGAVLVMFQIVHGGIILGSRQGRVVPARIQPMSSDSLSRASDDSQNLYPDIYYIVADGYGRSDVLQELYEFDNSRFIDRLRALGFHIADSSYANYPQTVHSLNASLNMNYVHDLGSFDRTSRDKVPLSDMLQANAVVDYFKKRGYTVVVLASGYGSTELKAADTIMTPDWNANEFENILISTTPLPLFAENRQSPYFQHRQRISYIFDKLPSLGGIPSPKFVFAHIVCPHPPFVFDADGDAIRPKGAWSFNDGSHLIKDSSDREDYIRGYRGQLEYATKLLLRTVTAILESSADNPPIILLQADHGPGLELNWYYARWTNLRERFGILNAYYLPDLERSPVYDEITPVNTFRMILNEYFAAGLSLLPDRHFFASWYQPFTFQPVSKLLGGSAYAHLLRQFASVPPDTVPLEKLSEPFEYGAQISTKGTCFMCEAGLCIQLRKVERIRRFEISVDYNDDYKLQYRLGERVVAVDSIAHRWIEERGLRIDTITVPSDAQERGFDNIVIYPSGGDGWYAIGHINPI